MHIPDGFISPQTYIPAATICMGLFTYSIKKLKKTFCEETLPLIAVLTAFSFILMMIIIPLPGGTTGHASGVAIIALIFGFWTSLVCSSMVLLIQAILFGIGGITSLPINILVMGGITSITAITIYHLFSKINEKVALFLSGYLSINLSALCMSCILGIQPYIAQNDNGQPLFFPFDFSITLPAIMIPHLLIGIGEGILTVLAYKILKPLINNKN